MFVEEVGLKNFKSFKNVKIRFEKGVNCIVGPNGSGKCVRGDSRVLVSNGKWLPIRELVETQFSAYGTDAMEDGEVLAANPENLCVFSLNPKTLKIEKKRIQAFVRRTSPEELYEIRTRSGRKIVSTGYHPVITIRNGIVESLRADELKEGMKAAAVNPLKTRLITVQLIPNSQQTIEMPDMPEVFWDEIASVSKVAGEEWVYDLCVEDTHNFLVEGIFVHNTNIVDAIMFALGESRIRSLRAKKTPDLIFNNAKFAEVELKLSDGKGANATVSRAIRRDGKIKYLLNGKRSHRYTVQDFLRQHNISTYNIIQQGQVQQIVQMNSKERRGLIDQVANVLEYEEKKKEAFAELYKVD